MEEKYQNDQEIAHLNNVDFSIENLSKLYKKINDFQKLSKLWERDFKKNCMIYGELCERTMSKLNCYAESIETSDPLKYELIYKKMMNIQMNLIKVNRTKCLEDSLRDSLSHLNNLNGIYLKSGYPKKCEKSLTVKPLNYCFLN